MKEVNYKIYQLSDLEDKKQLKIAFKAFDWIKDDFSFSYYKKTYEGSLEVDTDHTRAILDILFTKFNVNRPADFTGYSLSVSDIIEMDGKYWYCDFAGWKDITDLCKEN